MFIFLLVLSVLYLIKKNGQKYIPLYVKNSQKLYFLSLKRFSYGICIEAEPFLLKHPFKKKVFYCRKTFFGIFSS